MQHLNVNVSLHMEYVDNLSTPCPLHEQPKDEIMHVLKALHNVIACVPNSLTNTRKHFAGNFTICITTITHNFR